MTPEAELLLMNASRAQLVREVIRPAIEAGEVVLCDRFYDSTVAYQGYGRQLDLAAVQRVIDFAVGSTRPDVTVLLDVSVEVSEARRVARTQSLRGDAVKTQRDRIEESGREFFERVHAGFVAIAKAEPERVRVVDAAGEINKVSAAVWECVAPVICG